MSNRKENVRRLCYEINFMVDFALKEIEFEHYNNAIGIIRSIKKRTHRIKRTTWRGDEKPVIKATRSRTFNTDVSNMPHF